MGEAKAWGQVREIALWWEKMTSPGAALRLEKKLLLERSRPRALAGGKALEIKNLGISQSGYGAFIPKGGAGSGKPPRKQEKFAVDFVPTGNAESAFGSRPTILSRTSRLLFRCCCGQSCIRRLGLS